MIASAQYNVVFDVAEQGYRTWKLALLPALAVAAITLPWFVSAQRHDVTDSERRNARAIVRTMVTIFVSFSVYLLIHSWSEYEEFVQRLRSGDFRTLSGPITDFQPGGVSGNRIEHFRVDDVAFDYGTAELTSAFHRTAGNGGPMREGLQVRLAVTGNKILRVEIRVQP